MKRLRILQALGLTSLIFSFTFLTHAATVRGIHLASKNGEVLSLYKDYYALVIGAGKYKNGWPELPGAEKDSSEVAAALGDYGFTVRLVTNPTSREIKKAISEMAFLTGKEENRALLLYFAGHGDTLNLADGTKLGYIIPTDCPLKDKDPLGFDDLAISMKEIEALALKVQSKHLLMVFDSCFSGALFSLVRAAPVEISEKSARPVRQFITAGGEGEQVPDRSVFKQVFLDGIKADGDLNGDGYVTGSELGMYLQTKVVNYSNGGQHPQYGKINNPRLDKGDFIFVPKATRQKEEMETGKADAERAQISEELKKLQEERRKNEELLEKLKNLLEAKVKSEEAQKKALEEQPRLAGEDLRTTSAETDAALRRMGSDEKVTGGRLPREAAPRKNPEEELQRVGTEGRKKPKFSPQADAGHPEEGKIASAPQKALKPRLERPSMAEPRLKIAVFPMHVSGPERARDRLLKGVHVFIDRTDLFRDVSSYYEMENRPDIKQIDPDLQKRDLWKSKSFFSLPEPNMNVVCEEAKKLGVDAVLTLAVEAERNRMSITAYVVNATENKLYSARCEWSNPAESVVGFNDMMKRVFEEYRKDI